MTGRPLTVLIVSNDPPILRHLSRFLNAFGYHARQIRTIGQAANVFQAETIDFVIMDSRSASPESLEQLRRAKETAAAGFVHTFLLSDEPLGERLADWLANGIDDLLERPIVYGELLARLRHGARIVEFERRLARQSAHEPLTGLLPRGPMLERAEQRITASGASVNASFALLVIDIDFFEQLCSVKGRTVCDSWSREIAQLLRDRAADRNLISYFCQGRFCVFRPQSTVHEARDWAEQFRLRTSDLSRPAEECVSSITVSCGVASDVSDLTQVLGQAEEGFYQTAVTVPRT